MRVRIESRFRFGIASLLALGGAGLALAGGPRDGRLAIDKGCVPIGCFPGDGPGYPVEITVPGAYLVTSDLDVTGEPAPEDVTAIVVSARGVDLDLGGFTLKGPVACNGDPPTCAPAPEAEDGVGVYAPASAVGVRIHDGAIRGFGSYGVRIESPFAHLFSLRLSDSGWTPVYVLGIASRVEQIVAIDSGGSAAYFDPGAAAAISDSTMEAFNGSGIFTAAASWVVGNAVAQQSPGAVGIYANTASLVSCNAVRNGGSGIEVTTGALVDHNAVNACALGTCGAGDWALLLDLGSGYTGNALYQANDEWVDGGNSLTQNLCHPGPC